MGGRSRKETRKVRGNEEGRRERGREERRTERGERGGEEGVEWEQRR